METTDDRMAALTPEAEWRPDTVRGLARFRERDAAMRKTTGMRVGVIATAAILCGGLLAYPHLWKSGTSAAAARFLKDGASAPEFALQDASGQEVRLSDYKGKVVVLNFWATWCRPCREEMPMLNGLASKYKSDGLAVIGVSVDDAGWKAVRAFLSRTPVSYPIVVSNEQFTKQYGVVAMPMTVIVDRSGNIAGMHLGAVTKDVWEREIGRLIAR